MITLLGVSCIVIIYQHVHYKYVHRMCYWMNLCHMLFLVPISYASSITGMCASLPPFFPNYCHATACSR